MTTVEGDVELVFHGEFGKVCHILRRVPDDRELFDPLSGEDVPLLEDTDAGRWWANADDRHDDTYGAYHRGWYTCYDLDGELVPESEEEEED